MLKEDGVVEMYIIFNDIDIIKPFLVDFVEESDGGDVHDLEGSDEEYVDDGHDVDAQSIEDEDDELEEGDEWDSTDDEVGGDIGDNRNEPEFVLYKEEAKKFRRPAEGMTKPPPSKQPLPDLPRKRKAEERSLRYRHEPAHVNPGQGAGKKCKTVPVDSNRVLPAESEDGDDFVDEDANLSKEEITNLLIREEKDEDEFYVSDELLRKEVKGEVWYNPDCRVPHFEAGMQFKDSVDFCEAVVKLSCHDQANLKH